MAWTSENLLLRRNTSRKLSDWRRARPSVQSLWRMMAHETIERTPRISSTPLATRVDRGRTSSGFEVGLSGAAPPCACRSRARGRIPSVRKRASGTSAVRRWNSAIRRTVSRCKNAVKPMLRLEFRSPMLRFLRIKRLAVIDALEVEFDPGLNVLTGETGAGKSILVEAVGLLLGGRASGDLVRTGEEAATIEAIFESGAPGPGGPGGEEVGEEVLVRREITAQGRSRAYINGQ